MTDTHSQQPLAFSDEGVSDAPPVVLSSSLGTTRAMWDPQVEALGRHYRVVRFDHLGHGQSDVPAGPYTLDQLGQNVLRLLDSLSIDKTSFIGLSMGGIIGQWLGVHAPDRINRLVLMCTAAHFPTEQSWRERAATVRTHGVAAVSEGVLDRWFTDDLRATEPDRVAPYVEMVRATPAEGYAGSCEALAVADLREQLATISAPTLAIAGEDDPSTTPDALRFIAERIPGAQLEIVPHAAHLANVEQPETVNELIVTHLAGQGS